MSLLFTNSSYFTRIYLHLAVCILLRTACFLSAYGCTVVFVSGTYLHSFLFLLGLCSWPEIQKSRHPQCLPHPGPFFSALRSPYSLSLALKILSIKFFHVSSNTGLRFLSLIFLTVFSWFQRGEGSKNVLILTC